MLARNCNYISLNPQPKEARGSTIQFSFPCSIQKTMEMYIHGPNLLMSLCISSNSTLWEMLTLHPFCKYQKFSFQKGQPRRVLLVAYKEHCTKYHLILLFKFPVSPFAQASLKQLMDSYPRKPEFFPLKRSKLFPSKADTTPTSSLHDGQKLKVKLIRCGILVGGGRQMQT